MFGQNRPTFGAPSTNTFGGFGSNTSTGFGQSAFGAKPAGTTTGPFQTNTGFGTGTSLFGNTTATTTQPSLFGTSTSTFGSTPSSTGFGTPATNTGFGFGNANTTPSVFGNPTPSTGIFGSSAPTSQAPGTTGIFGAPSNTTFGAQAKPAFGFGNTQPSGGLFGQAQTQPAQTNALFGQPQAATSGSSLFGSSGFGSGPSAFGSTGPVGTTVKFNPPTGTDSMMKNNIQTNINTHHQCITCMKEYEGKSLEELRFEDYSAGRKTAGTGAQPAGGLFGSTTTTQTPGFGFGQTQQKPLFGSTTPSMGQTSTLFGQPQQQAQTPAFGAKPLGFPQTSTAPSTGFGFGQQPAQQATSLFGQAQPAKPFGTTGTTSLFGAPATSQPAPSFGAPQTTASGFGFGTPQQSTSLFGATKPAFGAATSSTGFGFGQTTTTTTAGTSLFGAKPATGFGATSAPSFGAAAPATAPSFGFGASGTGLFGTSSTTPAFGAKPAGTTPFGSATATQPTLSFGQPTQTSLFGSTTAATAPKQGLFGTTNTGFGASSFGSAPNFTATGTANMGTGLFGGTTNAMPSSMTPLGQAAAAPADSQLPIHQYILTLSEISQSSDHPLFRKMLEPSGKTEELLKSSPRVAGNTAVVPTPPQYRISPHPSNKIRTKALVNGSVSKSGRRSIFEGMSDEEDNEEPSGTEQKTDFFVPRRSVKKLQLKTITLDANNDSDVKEESEQSKLGNNSSPAEADLSETDARIDQRSQELDDSLAVLKSRRPAAANALLKQSSLLERSNFMDETGVGEGEVTVIEEANESVTEQHPPHPIGIELHRVGYYTIPSLDDLAAKGLDSEGKCVVNSFTVARRGYGQIFFEGPIDIANLKLDEIVFFRHKEVTVYPDDSKKPPLGQGLNRRAEITLDRVWPVDKSTGEYITDPERLAALRFEERLARAAHRLTAKFIEYRPESGSWVFRVNHFSKYGLEDSDEENELPAVPAKTASLPVVQAQAQPPVSDGVVGLGGVANALMQTSTMSITLEEDMRVEDELVSSINIDGYAERTIKSPPPVTTQLARTLGMPSQRVQIMKASFFEPDEGVNDFQSGVGSVFKQSARIAHSPLHGREEEFGTNSKSLFRTNLSSAIYNPSESEYSISDKSFGASSKKVVECENFSNYTRLEHVNQSQEVAQKIVPRFASAEIALSESYMNDNSNLFSDASLARSRSFRVGWGPGLQYFELNSMTRVSIVPVKTCDFEIDEEDDEDNLLNADARNPYVVLLATLLKFSKRTVQNGVPTFSPIPGCEAIASLKAATEALLKRLKAKSSEETADNLNYMRHVWNLCLALWKPLDLPSGSHAELMARKDCLSDWLEEVTAESSCFGMHDEEQVLALLARHDVAGAARLAHKLGDHYLSLLIAQAGSSVTFRGILQRQLQLWADNRSDSFISETRLRIFALLAGVPYWESSSARINTCADLDWIKSLAHHLWYIISPVASVADALLEYELACGISQETNDDELEIYAVKPFPDYSRATVNELEDLRYQLLSLFCRRGTRLEKLVNPLSHTWNVNESMLSWLLWQQLQALGYSHMSAIASAQLTIGFGAQLESCGLWQWAVFVYLHLNASTGFIRKLVQDIIGRHVGLESDERSELFLTNQLGIPQEWIEEARATKALYSFAPKLQAVSLVAAGNYDLAHEVICDQLAPEAILSETYDELEKLLAPLASPDRSCTINNWALKGKIYWNYLLVVKAVDNILKQANGNEKGVQLEKLTPDLTSLCNQVSSLPTTTPKHRLARTEVAQKAALILKNVIGLQSINSSSQELVIPPRLVLPQLRQLPVTQDYSLTELNSVVRAYFLELNV